jgi:hypothetical protein
MRMRTAPACLGFALLAGLTACSQGETPSPQSSAGLTTPSVANQAAAVRRGNWLIEETENFSICRPVGYRYDGDTGAALEKARAELQEAWLPKNAAAGWKPKCQIVLHASAAGYLQAVGRGAEATTGSALVDFDKGQISARKIDIRGDRADWFSAALTHELTHVVLADRFIAVAIPHWADEGMAILADTPDKRGRHAVDLHAALGAGGEFRLAELLTLGGYPQPRRMGAFYGQSASLVDYLTTIGSREQLVAMVERATSHGYDVALREIYSIQSVRHLERDWRQHVADTKTASAKKAAAEKMAANQAAAEKIAADKAGKTAANAQVVPVAEVVGAAAME